MAYVATLKYGKDAMSRVEKSRSGKQDLVFYGK
jgi:hypothetical protein